MTGPGGQRALVERAVASVLSGAPPGWSRLEVQFHTGATPVASASVLGPWGRSTLNVPADAAGALAEYHRQEVGNGASWRQLTIECDHTGLLRIRSDPPPIASPPPPMIPPPTVPALHRRTPWWLWPIAAAAVLALVVAVAGRDDGASLRAISASESWNDAQAREAAEKTVMTWTHERNEGNYANLEALTCPDAPDSWVSRQLTAVSEVKPPTPFVISALAVFTRDGSTWTLNAMSRDRGGMFVMRIIDGELRVCDFRPAPIP